MTRRDDHLRSPDFLDVNQYPSIAFKSKRGSLDGSVLKVVGDLTLHGVTKEVTLEGKYLGTVKDQSGNERIAAQASTRIDRKDFGLVWNKLIEAGPVVGDDVTISLKIEAVRQAGESKK
jgi:polyisoprenoid-binding protein YceI